LYTDVSAIVLAGGKSSRMGENKSFLRFGNRTLIEIILQRCLNLFDEVILVTRTPEDYPFDNIIITKDRYEKGGPLAGIEAGLNLSRSERNLVVSCDVPFFSEQAMGFIVEFNRTKPLIVPSAGGFVHHLCGIYSKQHIVVIRKLLEEFNSTEKVKGCKMSTLIERVGGLIINFETEFKNYSEELFMNLNTPEDYEIAKRKFLSLHE
jgi:molybdopterin-guanine dinucleotide biosynthesis protein A